MIGSVQTKGRFTGFWLLDQRSNKRVFGAFYYNYEIQSQRTQEHRVPTLMGKLPMTIKAGTYKLAFFTEAPAVMKLPMSCQTR